MFRRFRSLRKKLICSVLLTLSIPIIIVVVIAQVRSQSAIRAQAKKLNENLLEMGIHQMDATWEGLDDVYRSIYLNEAFREYLLHYGQQTGPNAAASESDLLKRVFLSSLSSRADLYSIIFVDGLHMRRGKNPVPFRSMRTLRFRMRILPVWNPIR
jgi:hypothetical protein